MSHKRAVLFPPHLEYTVGIDVVEPVARHPVVQVLAGVVHPLLLLVAEDGVGLPDLLELLLVVLLLLVCCT